MGRSNRGVMKSHASAVCALLAVLGVSAIVDSESRLPDESQISYQERFPGTRNKASYRLPGFMDMFAALSTKEYINVGLKWNVVESKAAMAYATRLSAGHAPIAQETDDYHIEAFSKPKSGAAPTQFTKLRFRQKSVYTGTLGYAETVQPNGQEDKAMGEFTVWDNKAKDFARFKAGHLTVARNAFIDGDLHVKGKISDDLSSIATKEDSSFAGTVVGGSSQLSKIEAPSGRPFGIYTAQPGAEFNPNEARIYVTDKGSVGVGTIKPEGQLHVKGEPGEVALRVDAGKLSVGGEAPVEVDDQKGVAGQRFMITPEGHVGINQAKPSVRFEVAGATKIDSMGAVPHQETKATLYVNNARNECSEPALRVKDSFYVASCNKVGVKTADPKADFHVNGNSKATSLEVDKDAKVAGKLTVGEMAPLKGKLTSDSLVIETTGHVKGKMEVGDDMVVKGNLWVGKEVKLIGGDTDMLESRLALIEESHSQLREHNEHLIARVNQLESMLMEQQSA